MGSRAGERHDEAVRGGREYAGGKGDPLARRSDCEAIGMASGLETERYSIMDETCVETHVSGSSGALNGRGNPCP